MKYEIMQLFMWLFLLNYYIYFIPVLIFVLKTMFSDKLDIFYQLQKIAKRSLPSARHQAGTFGLLEENLNHCFTD